VPASANGLWAESCRASAPPPVGWLTISQLGVEGRRRALCRSILAAMDAMELLLTRRSHPKLGDPAPSGDALDRILRAALPAPDHGGLRTTRILVIEGPAREKLGDAIAAMVDWGRRTYG